MAAPVDPAAGLARAFADFWLLPDLLALGATAAMPPPSWVRLLERSGFATDHVADEDLPDGPNWASIMAEDVWRIAEWLELVRGDGLTDAGRSIAEVANYPEEERTQAVWGPADATMATQVRAHYRGAGGISVAQLVQDGARSLMRPDDVWAAFCPGLLLVEFEALVYLAQTDPQSAANLVEELPDHRRDAMQGTAPPSPDVPGLLHRFAHADAVSQYYSDQLPGFTNEEVLTITAAQATAIVFIFCGLLSVPLPHLPVQFLVVPGE